MTRHYLGIRDDGKWEVFGWDDKAEPTEEETGYASITGPFTTWAEAIEAASEADS